MLCRSPTAMNVTTTEDPTTILAIRNDAFHQLLDRSPTVRTAVLAAAGARMREMDSESAI